MYSIFKQEKIIFRTIIVEICLLMICVLLSFYFLRMQSHGQVNLRKAGKLRYESYLLADQLRQSSDDLTQMARTYAATGNSMFEDYFWEILDIREGKKPRPINYERIYWDFMTVKEPTPPFPKGKKLSLNRLMKKAGFTKREFQLLDEAKQMSDKLISLENIAMNAMKGKFQDEQGEFSVVGNPAPELARQMLFGEKYHNTKKSIMEPINNFLKVIDKRTSQNVKESELQVKLYQKALLFAFGTLIFNGVLLFLTTQYHQSIMIDRLETDVKERTEELSIKNQELSENEEKFRSLSDAAFEGIIIFDKRKILEVNNVMANMFGYSTTDIVGMKPIDLVSPENRDEVQRKILSRYEESYEMIGLKKDGSSFPLVAHAKMFSYKGQQVRVTAIHDLTEKKKAEEEIKKLRGIIPICMHCKGIRDDKGYWNQLEKYISEHAEVQFSHGICEKCLSKHYPGEAD